MNTPDATNRLGETSDDPAGAAMQLLSAHVPLSLLLDLSGPSPHSRELFATEAADLGWLPSLCAERRAAPGQAETA